MLTQSFFKPADSSIQIRFISDKHKDIYKNKSHFSLQLPFLAPRSRTPKHNTGHHAVNGQSLYLWACCRPPVRLGVPLLSFTCSLTTSYWWWGLHKAQSWNSRFGSLQYTARKNYPLWYHIQFYFWETVYQTILFIFFFWKTHASSFHPMSTTLETKLEGTSSY